MTKLERKKYATKTGSGKGIKKSLSQNKRKQSAQTIEYKEINKSMKNVIQPQYILLWSCDQMHNALWLTPSPSAQICFFYVRPCLLNFCTFLYCYFEYWCKNKTYHTVGILLNYNRKIIERANISTPNKYIEHHTLWHRSWGES